MPRKNLPATILLLVLFQVCQAQNEKITVKNSFWSGTKYYRADMRVNKSEVVDLLAADQEALNLFRKGAGAQSAATILGTIGGFLIGWPIGGAIAGQEDPKWAMAGVGAGFLAVGIPIYSGGTKKITSAVDLYNQHTVGMVGPHKSNCTLALAVRGNEVGIN